MTQFSLSCSDLAELHSSFPALQSYGGVAAVAAALKVDAKAGIDGGRAELETRTTSFGTNTFPAKKSKPFWKFAWEACKDETLIMLVICACVSLIVGLTAEDPSEGWYDGAGIGFAVILVVLVSSISNYQQSLQFQRLNNEKQKIFLTVSRSGKRENVCIFDIVVGDIVHLNIGDQIPADGLLVSMQPLTVDESSMTGESDPLHKDASSPSLLSGCKVLDGFGSFLVTSVGMNTEWGRVMATLSEDNAEETPLQIQLNLLATMIGKVGLFVAVVVFGVLMIRFLVKVDYKHFSSGDGRHIVDFFAIAVTIVVVAIPEGLPLAVTLTLAYSMRQMMEDRALVRHLAACETMGSATTICSDKTGTLTINKMTLVNSWLCGMLKVPNSLKDEFNPSLMKVLFEAICVNTNGSVYMPKGGGSVEVFGSPTEKAILSWGVQLGAKFEDVRDEVTVTRVEAFNSTKKRMGTLFKSQEGRHWVHWKGASEVVLDLCTHYYNGEGSLVPLTPVKIVELKSVIDSFANAALRTLCFACKELSEKEISGGDRAGIPDNDLTCLAIVGIKDPCRPGVPEAVFQCQRAGIKVRMVTGDNMITAKAIAAECGILTESGTAIEGKEFRAMTVQQQQACLPSLQVMARSSPTDKHTLVKRLLEMGEIVAVTGDGTNDAPALHEASIGLAMGIAGTEVAKESSDIIILDDNFASIVKVVRWGRAVYVNIQKFIQFQTTVNAVALALNFISAIVDGEAPLTAVQLLWVNLIMDTLGALALATEPPSDSLMDRKPVHKREPLISNIMWRNIIFQAAYQLGMLLVLQFHGLSLLSLQSESSTNDNVTRPSFSDLPSGKKKLITVIFNSFVLCQIFNEVNSRKVDAINIFEGLLSNRVFLNVIIFTCLMQALIVEFAGNFASTVPLSWKLWLVCIGLGFISWPLGALVKCLPVPRRSLVRRWWRRGHVLSKKGTSIKRLVVSTSFQSRATDSRDSRQYSGDASSLPNPQSVAAAEEPDIESASPPLVASSSSSKAPSRRTSLSMSRPGVPVVSQEAAPGKIPQLAW